VLPSNRLKPGDRVRIIPNHACTVTNLADQLLLVDGLRVLERIPVAARGKNY
jgi:D-serine deaminase-like pyridoxal phosphate-dependent protein